MTYVYSQSHPVDPFSFAVCSRAIATRLPYLFAESTRIVITLIIVSAVFTPCADCAAALSGKFLRAAHFHFRWERGMRG